MPHVIVDCSVEVLDIHSEEYRGSGKKSLTTHVKVTPNAWHFQFKVGFGVYGEMV